MVKIEKQVFFYIGEERYLKEIALDKLKASVLGNSPKELDYKIFYGGEGDSKEIIDYLLTFPFSSGKRFVVVKDPEKLPEEERKRLAKYITNPAKSTCLVVDSRNDSMVKEFPSLRRHVEITRFDNPSDSEILSWIKGFVSSRGKTIDDGAIELLKELQGQDLLSLTQEVEKLVSYIGDRKEITLGDVENLVGRSIIKSAFDITGAIGEKKTQDALQLAWDLALSGMRVYGIIGILSWHMKRLLRAKLLQSEGRPNYSIANILGLNRNHTTEFFRQVKSFDIAQIKKKLDILLETDLNTKRPTFKPEFLLELAIVRLCLA